MVVSIPMTELGDQLGQSESETSQAPYYQHITSVTKVCWWWLYDDAAGTDPTSWDGEVNGATSNLKY